MALGLSSFFFDTAAETHAGAFWRNDTANLALTGDPATPLPPATPRLRGLGRTRVSMGAALQHVAAGPNPMIR